MSDGGAAAIVTDGTFDNPNSLATLIQKGSKFTCSYEEEQRALNLGLDWLTSAPPYNHVMFCTDILFILQALENDHPGTLETRQRLQFHANTIFELLYVPGHKDIPGNELAAQHSKAAARLLDAADDSIPFRAAKAIIRKEIRDPPPKHRHTKRFFADLSIKRDDEQLKSRREETTIAQLRSGHYKGLAYYDALADDTRQTTSDCKRCNSGEVDDVEHWLTQCAQTAAARQKIFGTHIVNMTELATSPARIIELAGRTLQQ